MIFWNKFKWWIVLAVGFLVIFIIYWQSAGPAIAPSKTIVLDKGVDTEDIYSLEIGNQPVGEVVTINKIKTSKSIWLAVHDEKEETIASTILGAGLLKPGEYQNFSFTLMRPMESGQNYYLVLYNDSGSREFIANTNLQEKNPDGTTIAYRFATIGRSSRGE